jgi:hypothetical protein
VIPGGMEGAAKVLSQEESARHCKSQDLIMEIGWWNPEKGNQHAEDLSQNDNDVKEVPLSSLLTSLGKKSL